MISTGDLKKGVTIEFEGQMCSVLDWQHVKMGRGGAIVRMKLRNLRTGSTFDLPAMQVKSLNVSISIVVQ